MRMPAHNWLKACLDGTRGLVGMCLAPTIVVLNIYREKSLTEPQDLHPLTRGSPLAARV